MSNSHSTGAPRYPATELPAIQRAGRRRVTRTFGRIMLIVLILTPIVLAFAPWQQNLPGQGRLIEFDPTNRPMPIQARTKGILMRWHVREGQYVKKGDPIVDLADNDPNILARLKEQIEAAERKLSAAQRKRDDLTTQVKQAEEAREAAMQFADDEIAAAIQKVAVKKQAEEAAKQKQQLTKFAFEMVEGLVADKIAAGFELQKARQENNVADLDVLAKAAEVIGAKADLRAKRSKRRQVERSEQVKVQETKAKRNTAEGDIAVAEGSLPKLKRDYDRQLRQQLVAPTDGYVQDVTANGQGGGFVKEGDTLAMLVPKTSQLAVELFIDGNDITFVDVGRHVRLQFEGWPAIQWVGWPSAAIGTFGGKVAFIDRFDSAGTGTFRVVVLPDERPFVEPEGPVVDWLRGILTYGNVHARDDQPEGANPHAWPGDPFLRQGVRVKGWIVLDEVSLGFEVWRQLNGFPPTVDRPKPSGDKGKSKGDK
ncbi:MAG: HlyD family secretion protein [Planctomycetota bacterium]